MKKKAYSIPEAATQSNIGKTKIYEFIGSGKLKARKIGTRTIILENDLDDFLSNLETYSSQKGE